MVTVALPSGSVVDMSAEEYEDYTRKVLSRDGSAAPPSKVPTAAPPTPLTPYSQHTWEIAAPLIAQHESGNQPYAGWTPPGQKQVDLSGVPVSETGFPIWAGRPGPKGNSTAAGLYQIVRKTWDPVARELGVTDFSPESQEKVARELFRRGGYSDWAPYNPRLAAAIGWGGGTPASSTSGGTSNPVHPSTLLTPITSAKTPITSAPLGADISLPPTSPSDLNFGLLMALAAPKNSIKPVQYDPFAVMPKMAGQTYTSFLGSKEKFAGG